MKLFLKLTALWLGTTHLWAASTLTLTFDELATPYDGYENRAPMTTYGSFQWNNFYVFNAADTLHLQNTGYPNALVSGKNIAFNWFGEVALFKSGARFDLNSAYLTAGWNDGLRVEVQGFVGTTLTHNQTFTINSTAPTLVNFNYLGVTEVRFRSFGGVAHGYPNGSGVHFAMDDLVVTIPEPAPVTIISLGAVLIMAWRRMQSGIARIRA